MISPSEALKTAIEQFCATDEETKREGYSKLFERVHTYVCYWLRKTNLTESEIEDLASEIMARIWENRDRTDFLGLTRWWKYVAKTTAFSFMDYARVRSRIPVRDEDVVMANFEADTEDIDQLLELAEDRRAFYRLADEVFLLVPPELSDRERDRRLLAAKLMLLDKESWQSVCAMLNTGTTEEEEVTRKVLDEWLSHRFVLRHLAYSELYWDNCRLCDHVLAAKSPPWKEDEIQAIRRHYFHADSLERIESALDGRIKKNELSTLFVRCARRFPFIDIVKRLKRDLNRSPYAKDEIRASGLWRRLAIQYYAKEALTMPQILERIETASTEAGYTLNEGKLNAGISSKRLLKKMSDHLAKRNGNAV